jgi:hypothetical protein
VDLHYNLSKLKNKIKLTKAKETISSNQYLSRAFRSHFSLSLAKE